MFRGDLLIDGYNVLHAAGLARRSYGPGEFEKARRRLLKLLAGQLFDRERRRTTVVFDAQQPLTSLGPAPPVTLHGIRVIFAEGDGDADAAIERLIQRNSAPRRLHVISSDHRLQKAARRRRCKFLDSEVFLARILRRPTPEERAGATEPSEKREGLSSTGEVEVWLRAFADVDDVRSPIEPAGGADATDVSMKRRSESRAETADADDSTTPITKPPDATPSLPDELTFWESRIAELWE